MLLAFTRREAAPAAHRRAARRRAGAAFPFALTYGLVYWGEQYIPSGLAAVLFGVLPLYVALLGAARAARPAAARAA